MSLILDPHNPGPVENPAHVRARALLQDDLTHVLKVGFAEQFAGYRRMQQPPINGHGPVWVHTALSDGVQVPASAPVTMDQLPNVEGTKYALLEFLDRWCAQMNADSPDSRRLAWGFNRTGTLSDQGQAIYGCTIVILTDGKQHAVATIRSTDPGIAIASAMLQVQQVDVYALHLQLFPHKYLGVP